tara:strand:- start:153 stop:1139 length:987 start_codon:yes stop_codon:yes gene_type:complete
MEFIDKELEQQFSDVDNSDFQNMTFDEKLSIFQVAMQKNINYEDLNTTLKFFNDIIVALIRKYVVDDNFKVRELSLFITLACVEQGGYLFEPYLSIVLPNLLDLLADKHINVIKVTDETLSRIFKKINPFYSLEILNLFRTRMEENSWKKSIGCMKLVSILAETAPEQIDYLLPELIPLITSQAASTKKELREESTKALNKCCDRISNPDVIPLIPKLLEANKDPTKAPDAIESLMETTFVSQVERSTLAVIVPILNRGLKDRASKLKRKCCVVIDNMCKLVNDSKDVKPFENELLPYIKREHEFASQPEVREMAGKAVATLERALKM